MSWSEEEFNQLMEKSDAKVVYASDLITSKRTMIDVPKKVNRSLLATEVPDTIDVHEFKSKTEEKAWNQWAQWLPFDKQFLDSKTYETHIFRVGRSIKYTPDFVLWERTEHGLLKHFIEVKGNKRYTKSYKSGRESRVKLLISSDIWKKEGYWWLLYPEENEWVLTRFENGWKTLEIRKTML